LKKSKIEETKNDQKSGNDQVVRAANKGSKTFRM
jgi:hypothetical protein